MTGKVLNLKDFIQPDDLGCQIARYFHEWDMLRQNWKNDKAEIRKYIFATDTTTTTNSKLPWKNKTTIPKLCQIRDNLFSNYMASMFPKRKWLNWLADDEDSNSKAKRDSILNYMNWVISQEGFKKEFGKLVLDYIDSGNVFGTVDWVDQRQDQGKGKPKTGYVGPVPRRLSPMDIVFNPTAPTFTEAPKIVRSIISLGEVKKLLSSLSTPENKDAYDALFEYIKGVRFSARQSAMDIAIEDEYYRVDGFTSMRSYLESDYVEVLTFYGDLYDWHSDTFLENHQIMVVDRHKVISKKPNPSAFGYAPIYHSGWRPRQDNLWAMGPLDNLVGMQYRIDHIENLKADVFDLIAFPVLKIKGYVEDFEWAPLERIIIGDQGDVEMLAPPFQILQANVEIKNLTDMMEEMSGSPKEAMGIRSPGEKTAYEVNQLQNASARIFQNKIVQFEEQVLEPLLNACLELASRHLADIESLDISAVDDDFNFQTFQTLTAEDITGSGRIKPIAARHFAEKAEMVQNLNTFFQSAMGQDQDIKAHFSSIKLARMFEDILDIKDYELVTPYIRMAEQADAQRIAQASQEQVLIEALTPAGIVPGDHDTDFTSGVPSGGPVSPAQPQAGLQPPDAPAGPPIPPTGSPAPPSALGLGPTQGPAAGAPQ